MIGDLTQNQMEDILEKVEHAHLACHADGETYCIPIFFAHENGYLYGHTYEGKKISMMRKNPHVCVLIHTLRDLWNWKSIVIQGDYEELSGEDAVNAVKLLSQRLGSLKRHGAYFLDVEYDSQSHYARQDHRPVILYRLKIKEMTGRFEHQGLKSA